MRERNVASRERLRRLAAALDAQALALEMPGGWTVSALFAHLAYWDGVALRRWQGLIERGIPPAHVPGVNDEMLPVWRAVPATDAVRQAVDAAEALDRVIDSAPAASIDTMVAAGFERSVDRSLHRDEHLGDIERALEARARG